MTRESFLEQLGIQHPILLAPLGGGPSTPDLAAAVTNAGGLGALGYAYMTPDQIRQAVRRTRELAPGKPVHVNLFAGAWTRDVDGQYPKMVEVLGEIHRELGLGEVVMPKVSEDPFAAQFEAMMELEVEVFSFTFGVPRPEVMKRLKGAGVVVMGTATTAEEAKAIEAAGCDLVIAQGAEAGGHRGTFANHPEAGMVPLTELLEQICRVTPLPVVAAGGLMSGRDVAAIMRRGASAGMLGSAFLTCPESGAAEAYKRALLTAGEAQTVVTRAFSGRWAQGLKNAFIERVRDDIVAPYPLQNLLTRPMRTEAAKQGKAEYLSLWAGRGVGRIREMGAGELVRVLVEEMKE